MPTIHLTLIVMISMLTAGCGTATVRGEGETPDPSQTIAIDCEDGWAQCAAAANRICGSAGYDEVGRSRPNQLTSAGRVDVQRENRVVYREDARFDDQYRSMVIRCRNEE